MCEYEIEGEREKLCIFKFHNTGLFPMAEVDFFLHSLRAASVSSANQLVASYYILEFFEVDCMSCISKGDC